MNFTLQVLTTLRFLAKGDYLSEVADMHGIPLASASRIIHSVCSVLCLCLDNIKFPTAHQLNRIKHEFCAICNFPNVVGAIDDTLILEWPVKRNLISFAERVSMSLMYRQLWLQISGKIIINWRTPCHQNKWILQCAKDLKGWCRIWF